MGGDRSEEATAGDALGERRRPGRRAAVLALHGEAERVVDDIRRRFDPEMAARIGAHVTVLHDVVDGDALSARLPLVADRPPLVFSLLATACWGPARYGIFLELDDRDGAIRSLYADLAELEEPRWRRTEYRPHVTLVHGGTVSNDTAERAWAELASWRADLTVCVRALSVLELGTDRWHEVQRVEFCAAGQHPPAGPV